VGMGWGCRFQMGLGSRESPLGNLEQCGWGRLVGSLAQGMWLALGMGLAPLGMGLAPPPQGIRSLAPLGMGLALALGMGLAPQAQGRRWSRGIQSLALALDMGLARLPQWCSRWFLAQALALGMAQGLGWRMGSLRPQVRRR